MAGKSPIQKSNPDRSPKAHQPPPPKKLTPKGETQGHRRGKAGQFTDKAAPGLEKK